VNRAFLGVCAGVAGLAALPAAAAGPEHNLAETIERFESLRVDAASVAVSDLRLTSGHLTLACRPGKASLVRAGEEVVGIFYQGSGSLEYQSVDPIEFPLTSFNARKATGLTAQKGEKSVTLRDNFTQVLWLAAGQTLPALPGSGGGPSLQGAFDRQQEKFHRARGRPVSHDFALQRFDAPSSTLVVAHVDGGTEDLEYFFDSGEDRSEGLLALHESQSNDREMKKLLFRTVLSDQPIGRDRRDPRTPRFVLTDVDWEVTASDGREAKISVIETLVPQGRRQEVFRFDLYNLRYTVVGAGVLEPRFFHVRSVTDGSGRSLLFDHRNDELLVALAAPAEPDRPVKVRFEIEGDFLVRPGGDNFWILGVEPWFPQPELGEQYYTVHSVVKVPKPFVPFASGKTVGRRTEGNLNVLETRVEQPVQFAVVLAGKYDFEEQTKNGVTIRVATYALKNTRAIKQLADLASSVIEYYQQFLGPFPFPEFNILEINAWGFGQAPPGVMFITKEAFNPLMGERNQLFSQGVNERFAHEIAHQYWGHVVKMPSHEEQWLTESFAEYSAALFLKQFKGNATYNLLVNHWKTRASFATDAAPIPLGNLVSLPNDSVTRFAIRTGLIYDKGAYLLAALHKELGDDTFFTFLKSYQKSFRWKFGSTKTVAGLLQYLTKKDYGPFFEANYWGTGMPAY
jgi:Peptidase family M1 domain